MAMPTPNRDQNSANAFTARPHENTMSAKNAGRPADDRAAPEPVGQPPIGSAPSTMNAPDAALMKTIAPSLTPKLSRMSGASTDSIADLEFVDRLDQQQHDEREDAADRTPCSSVSSSPPTPGRRSSANSTSSLAST